MKATVYTIEGKKKGEVELPFQFEEEVRPDLIKRAALAVCSTKFQPKGSDILAGTRQGYTLSKQRHSYKCSYGKKLSRVRRKHSIHRGDHFSGLRGNWTGAFVASAVKGRTAFPPRVEKIIIEDINRKERKKAIRSAIAATASLEHIRAKHAVESITLPLVVEDKLQDLNKTKEIISALNKLGLAKELMRTKQKKIRAGKGKLRGRRYRRKKGILLAVDRECALTKGARNIPGIDVALVKNLNADTLAPGAQAGRLTIWTESALKALSGGLFR